MGIENKRHFDERLDKVVLIEAEPPVDVSVVLGNKRLGCASGALTSEQKKAAQRGPNDSLEEKPTGEYRAFIPLACACGALSGQKRTQS
jgi:hypothetical protein